uniref:Oxysterol-binding protein n=1 Tax=Steinernema glaseri TaxID=37863 RepID=A0A1I7ZN79_9BILA
MLRRQQRGCIRLRGAQIGIDGENNSLFTVTVDGKVFHLQGRDQNERDQWVKALEKVIHSKCGYYKPVADPPGVALKNHIADAEKQLSVLIEEVRLLDKSETPAGGDRKEVQALLGSANRLIDIVKHSVICLQMAHKRIDGIAYDDDDDDKQEDDKDDDVSDDRKGSTSSMVVPPLSYSSSEDEFFDAESMTGEKSPEFRRTSARRQQSEDAQTLQGENGAGAASRSEPDWGDDGEDFDAIYDNNQESDLGNVQQQHGSVLMHLLSQVSVGMDLTKVTLPTFILERRSLLEMYADFFAHPDDFIVSTQLSTPEERFISVVRYYLNAFYAARKSGVAKKPYNPILGETFRCRWKVPELPDSGIKTTSGPYPGSDINELTFIAEQVSHHPPISAFYAEVPSKKISFNAHIWTKSSFLGLSIGVANIGQGVVKLHEFDEEYTMTFPSGYGRSIMSTPWVELGGKVDIRCEKTGYYAEVEFLTKPFFGGKAHRVSGNVYKDGVKRPILTIKGEWNGVMMAKPANGEEYVFIDVKSKEEVRKECESVNMQGDRESRRLWRHVTAALFHNRISAATNSKRWIEQRQRDEAKERKERGTDWTSSHFRNTNQHWHYMHTFADRSSL